MIEVEKSVIEHIVMEWDEFERMKNCVNCDHSDVCVIVHDRKRRQAGDYSPCGKWKLVET